MAIPSACWQCPARQVACASAHGAMRRPCCTSASQRRRYADACVGSGRDARADRARRSVGLGRSPEMTRAPSRPGIIARKTGIDKGKRRIRKRLSTRRSRRKGPARRHADRLQTAPRQRRQKVAPVVRPGAKSRLPELGVPSGRRKRRSTALSPRWGCSTLRRDLFPALRPSTRPGAPGLARAARAGLPSYGPSGPSLRCGGRTCTDGTSSVHAGIGGLASPRPGFAGGSVRAVPGLPPRPGMVSSLRDYRTARRRRGRRHRQYPRRPPAFDSFRRGGTRSGRTGGATV